MKKHLLSIAFLVVATTIFSCKKNDPTTPATSASATVTASNYGFDGIGTSGKFSSTTATITQASVGGVDTFTLTAIKDGSNEAITITILKKITATGKTTFAYNDASTGSIVITKDGTNTIDRALVYTTLTSNNTTKGGGEVNITKLDGNKVEGNFYFVAVNGAGKEAWAENGAFSGTIK